MAKPHLPSRPSDVWEGGFLFDAPSYVSSVCARGGLVAAGGTELYLLRPGAEHVLTRPPPLDIGQVNVTAVEPRGSRRYAFATDDMIAVFFKNNQGDQILRLRPSEPGRLVTHLAWGGAKGQSALYIRWDDSGVTRLRPDMSDMDDLEVPPMDAVASDETGNVAMVSLDGDPRVYVTQDGEKLHARALGYAFEEYEHVYLAVAGMAVAVAVDNEGAFLSRKQDEPLTPCEALAGVGPVEFEGTSSDSALFGAALEPTMSAIIRVDREGAAMRVAEIGNDDGVPPQITSLAWDASRRKLWGAAPVGLITSTPPGAKRGKKVSLS